jgi:hypothetical protein
MATQSNRYKSPQIPDAVVMREVRAAAKRRNGPNYVTAPDLADKYAKLKNERTGRPRRSIARHVMQRMADRGEIDLYQVGNKLAATLPGQKLKG